MLISHSCVSEWSFVIIPKNSRGAGRSRPPRPYIVPRQKASKRKRASSYCLGGHRKGTTAVSQTAVEAALSSVFIRKHCECSWCPLRWLTRQLELAASSDGFLSWQYIRMGRAGSSGSTASVLFTFQITNQLPQLINRPNHHIRQRRKRSPTARPA